MIFTKNFLLKNWNLFIDSLFIVKDDSKTDKKPKKSYIIQTYNKTKDTSEKQPFLFYSNLLNQSLEAYK